VPTWNYVAVELEGFVRPIETEALVRLLDDMSAEQEARLAPKPAWTRDKMGEGRFEGLLKSITGSRWRWRPGAEPRRWTRTSRRRYATGSPTLSPGEGNGIWRRR
jgi:hypothetical protein